MFDTKETDLFELEDEDFDTIMESDLKFTGSIRFAKPFMIRGIMEGTITATSECESQGEYRYRARACQRDGYGQCYGQKDCIRNLDGFGGGRYYRRASRAGARFVFFGQMHDDKSII